MRKRVNSSFGVVKDLSRDIKELELEKTARQISDRGQNEQKELYTWRIDLSKTEPHWIGWFKGLSKLFLSCRAPKLLVLAGVDRLDTDLIVGQMQGKFQETILPKAGHAVQEDSPEDLADTLASFAIRNRFCHPLHC
ncbi:PME-1 [Dirofilaria immitis]|nr:PME-1 [Dirofilaria immitis]